MDNWEQHKVFTSMSLFRELVDAFYTDVDSETKQLATFLARMKTGDDLFGNQNRIQWVVDRIKAGVEFSWSILPEEIINSLLTFEESLSSFVEEYADFYDFDPEDDCYLESEEDFAVRKIREMGDRYKLLPLAKIAGVLDLHFHNYTRLSESDRVTIFVKTLTSLRVLLAPSVGMLSNESRGRILEIIKNDPGYLYFFSKALNVKTETILSWEERYLKD